MKKQLISLSLTLVSIVLITSHTCGAVSDLLSNAWDIEGKISFVATETTGMYVKDRFNVTVSKVFSLSPNKFRREYIYPPFLAGNLLIDDGVKSYYYQPQKRLLIISPSMFDSYNREIHNRLLQLILKNYTVSSTPDRFLDREVTRLSVYPKEGGAPVLILWIDNQTNVILRREKYLPNGKMYEYSFYTDIDFNTVPNERLFIWKKPREGYRMIERSDKFIPIEEAKRHGVGIPLSFHGREYECINIKEVPGGAAYQFSDGINNFILFSLEILPPLPPSSRKITVDGIRYSYWQIDSISGFAWNYREKRFLVIGMVERDIVERLIKSIK